VFVAVATTLNVPLPKFDTNNCEPFVLNATASGADPTGMLADTVGGLCVKSTTLTLFEPSFATYAVLAETATPVGIDPTATTGSPTALARPE
jgi:hypothetical protein